MSLAVVVPTYNEAENLAVLAERVLALRPAFRIVCVDDDSPDGTGEIADAIAAEEPRFTVIHRRAASRGYARASLEGLAEAHGCGDEFVCTMDADLSHDPSALPALVERARGGCDLVVGSRYVDGGALEVAWGPWRRAVSRLGSAYARRMLGVRVRDCTSGFRCYGASAVDAVLRAGIASEGYSFLIEALRAIASQNLCIAEEPIRYVDRARGESKIGAGVVLEALWRTTGWGLARVFGKEGAVDGSCGDGVEPS